MNFLTDNFIANMHGPEFLTFFALAVMVVYVISAIVLRILNPARRLAPPSITNDPNPYEIAYLRGGENEVLRLLVLELIQRGYLRTEDARIVAATAGPDPRHLEDLPKIVYEHLAGSQMNAKEMFESDLPGIVKRACEPFEENFSSESLILNDQALRLRWRVGIPAAIAIAALSGYKLCVALSRGRTNIEFLVIMTAVALVLLAVVCAAALPRLTSRGKEYLADLRVAFNQLKPTSHYTTATAMDPHLLLLAGIFGTAVLAGTAYAGYNDVFKRASTGTGYGSGCGSSCGSSCGSTSSCSGGSSCGGGGCGGGCGGCGS